MNPPLERSSAADVARHALAWAAWPCDRVTPVRAFLALRAAGRQVCLLESVEGPARLSRYSFLGVDPSSSFRGRAGASVLTREGETTTLPGSTLAALRGVTRPPRASAPAHLPPFAGGWIGWFAHEWSSELEPSVPRAAGDPWNVPEATLDLYESVVAFDHAAQKLFVITLCDEGAQRARAEQRLDAIAADALADHGPGGDFRRRGALRACTPPETYRAGVTRLRAEIAAGEIFQAVLSQRFEQDFEGDPFTLYRVLRLTNPSPHMFYFEADGLTLIGSSPERLVSVRGSRVENRPIAGTRPRGADPEQDERLGIELKADPKERAEHEMLVDLARNDLGRIARTGSVRVREHAVLERFARVQHLVSRVECELARGRDALDALAAAFPAGTVSGAPKVRAQQLLAGIESQTRGPYAGAFGYLDLHGNLDMTLAIRTFAARAGVLSVQAGAGVVFDSDPEREHQETLHKASALFEAVALADSEAFRAPQSLPSAAHLPVSGARA